jgi:putative transposase
MPRANRYQVADTIYHLTHRCHDRQFLLRFAKDRNVYRDWMREGLRRYPVSLLAYCITSNHVHLVLHAEKIESVSRFMQLVEGSTAQQYNLRKKRSGGFWSERYHCTMVDSGSYLCRCLQYVDLNMVRAGVVKHPRDWEWGSYRELMGERRRYRLLNVRKLLDRLGYETMNELRSSYSEEISRALTAGISRDATWTENLAVGSKTFVDRMSQRWPHRRALEVEERGGTWMVREAGSAYDSFLGIESRSKATGKALNRG